MAETDSEITGHKDVGPNITCIAAGDRQFLPSSQSFVVRHQLITYFALAFAGSWLFMIPLALSAQGFIGPLPMSLHYGSAYGPMVAALVVTGLSSGSMGLRELAARMMKWRVGSIWIVISLCSPLLLYAAGAGASLMVTGKAPDIRGLGHVNFLPDLGIPLAALMWIFNSGIGEETGWRGFALPRLQKSHSALGATIILALLWSLWHLPAFFYLPSYQRVGLIVFPGFALGVTAGAIVLTWLYNSTSGSLLMLILWHGLWNLVSAPPASAGPIAAVASTLVMVWAVVTVVVFGAADLSRRPKQVV